MAPYLEGISRGEGSEKEKSQREESNLRPTVYNTVLGFQPQRALPIDVAPVADSDDVNSPGRVIDDI